MKALRIHAGPLARRHIEANGLKPQDVRVIPGAAGGPKGLILGPIDRFLFGHAAAMLLIMFVWIGLLLWMLYEVVGGWGYADDV